MYVTLWNIVVTTECATSFNITELCISPTEYVYGFYMILRMNSWFKRPEIGTSSIDWAQVEFLPEDGGRVQSPKRCFK
jgi:hypothetical protein